MNHTKSCFVLMPYGKKVVEIEKGKSREIDFDSIYEKIFAPGFLDAVDAGLGFASARWQAQTFAGSLSLLVEGGVDLPGLADGMALIAAREALLP